MKAVTRYKLHEGILIIVFFFAVFFINILVSNVQDVPILRSIIGAVFLGSITAWFEIVISVKLQKKMNRLLSIIVNFLFYYLVFSIMLIAYGYINLIFKVGLPPSEAFQIGITEIYPVGFNVMIFYLFIFLFILQLIRQTKVSAVRGLTKKYLTGSLNQPVEDVRIFLFMDLYSSTAYAERLGHLSYSCCIKEIYSELDEYILQTRGSLYQFVGDQVVIVWNMKDGLAYNNAVRFFFLVEEALKKKEQYYRNKYGVFPRFKAGIHYGKVSITEVGNILKREIAYHGDVVNTTARICSLCSEINEQVLISGDFYEKLKPTMANCKLKADHIGAYNLKGKKNEVDIYRLYQDGVVKKDFDFKFLNVLHTFKECMKP